MLTKELLRFRVRSGKILPEFIAPESALERTLAAELIEVAHQSIGAPYGEARSAIADLTHGGAKSAAGMAKLITDRLVAEDPHPDVAGQRWELLVQAEGVRRAAATRKDFEASMGSLRSKNFAAIGAGLYADLPDARAVAKFESIEPEPLIHRYNVALVQGLLLRAEVVQIKLKKTTLAERRRLFRAMRFHRLIPAVQMQGDQLVIELGGPLSIFGAAGIYGVCITNFIPHIFSCAEWDLEAQCVVKNKRLTLKLSEKSGLVSHYKQTGSYIPEEFAIFTAAFAKRFPEWEVSPAGEPLMLGQGSWCVPDFSFRSPSGKIFFMELFHKWHAGALAARVKKLAEQPRGDLILGVCRQISGHAEVAKDPGNLEVFSKYAVQFTDFPTPTAVMAILKNLA